MPDFPSVLPDELEANARLKVRVDSDETLRRILRVIEGTNITLSLTDDSVNEEAELTITGPDLSSFLESGDAAGGDLGGTFPNPDVVALQGFAVDDGTPSDGDVLTWDDGNSEWAATEPTAGITAAGARVATEEATASTSYTDLATVGPAVTLTTGTSVLVTIGCMADPTEDGNMSFAVSGASTVAADDSRALVKTSPESTSRQIVLTGLTAGSNTFTAKYRSEDGDFDTAFSDRDISVITLP